MIRRKAGSRAANLIHAPGWTDPAASFQVAHHTLVSHGEAIPILRAYGDDETQVGITLNFTPSYPASDKSEDVAAASRHDGFNNRWFVEPLFKGRYDPEVWSYLEPVMPRIMPGDMEIITRPIDFLGVNFYTRAVLEAADDGGLDFAQVLPEGDYTAMEWEVYPQALTDLLVRLHEEYSVPDTYITENGCAYSDTLTDDGHVHDIERTAYYRKHFAAAHAAIEQGAPLKGYYVWSLMDNFEWAFGYARRFGMVYVDFETQKRYPKDSALYFSTVAAQNAVEIDPS